MDISALKYFITVAETQHMNRAAALLNITQPSLSASIKRLEAELGCPLFDRNGRGIKLNDYGRIYLRGAMAALNALEKAQDEIRELCDSKVNFIRLSCSGSATNSSLIELLIARGIHLKVSIVPQDWPQRLFKNDIDLVITLDCPAPTKRIFSYLLARQEIVMLVGNGHPLCGAKNLTTRDLKYHPFCSTDSAFSILNIINRSFPENPLHPKVAFLGRNSTDMLQAIRTGQYIGLMVRKNLPEDKGLHILDVRDFSLSLPLYLHCRALDTEKRAFSQVIQAAVDFYAEADKERASELPLDKQTETMLT